MPRRILLLTRTFQEKDHAEAFLRGQIRAEKLACYRGTEDQARSDPREGIPSLGMSWKLNLRSSRGNEIALSYEAGDRMEMQFGWTDKVNILCTTASYIGTEWVSPDDRSDEVLDRYVRIPEAAKKFGGFSVLVHKPRKFLDRAAGAAEKEGLGFDCGLVDYSGRTPNLTTADIIFCKGNEYKYEREFRLAFSSPQEVEGPLTLEIGDLSNIASLFRTQEINGMLTITAERGPDKETPEALSWKDDL